MLPKIALLKLGWIIFKIKSQWQDSAFVKFSVRQNAPGLKKAMELLLINFFIMQK